MRFFTRLLFLASTLFLFGLFAEAQILDPDDTQSWNDVQLTVPLHERVDLVFQGTARFGQNITRFSEGRGGVGLAFKPASRLTVIPSYHYIEVRGPLGPFRTEHRFTLRAAYNPPLEWKGIGFSHRSMYEYRKRSVASHWRYRPSITIERALPENFLPNAKVFITQEPFYSSLTKSFSRNRLSAGVTKTLNAHLALDIYYLRQNDGLSIPGDLHVIGTNWKIRL